MDTLMLTDRIAPVLTDALNPEIHIMNHADYTRDPAKYELFKTARIGTHVFTENGEHDLEPGRYVAVQFLRHAWNGMRRRNEPVYTVTADGKVWGCLFGNVLTDFVL